VSLGIHSLSHSSAIRLDLGRETPDGSRLVAPADLQAATQRGERKLGVRPPGRYLIFTSLLRWAGIERGVDDRLALRHVEMPNLVSVKEQPMPRMTSERSRKLLTALG